MATADPPHLAQLTVINKTAEVWYYTMDEQTKDFVCVLLIGAIYRVVAYIAMIKMNQEKQS